MSHAPHSGESAGSLWNHDLAPTLPSQRTWTWYHFAALWIGMVMCIPAYTLAASMITNGMSWSQAVRRMSACSRRRWIWWRRKWMCG